MKGDIFSVLFQLIISLKALTQGYQLPHRPHLIWPIQASVTVMAFAFGAVFFALLTGLLFIVRLFIVVKTGSKCQPGSKGSVAVLVVVGSGNVHH